MSDTLSIQIQVVVVWIFMFVAMRRTDILEKKVKELEKK